MTRILFVYELTGRTEWLMLQHEEMVATYKKLARDVGGRCVAVIRPKLPR